MKLGLRRSILGTAATIFVCMLGVAVNGQGQAAPERSPLAEEVFKNVQVLKGMPVNDFMATMGIFSASLGMSCQDCHAADDRTWEGFAADNARKRMARTMITMMATINKTHFGGRQVVSCYSCHRGADRPRTAVGILETLYGPPPENPNHIIAQAPGQPMAAAILDKYLAAIGGAQKMATLTSYVATGTAVGFGPESAEERKLEIYARAPGQRTSVIHTGNGDDTSTVSGANAWLAGPLRPVAVLPLAGKDLDGARFDAMLAFPAQIKTYLNNMRVGFPAVIDDRDVNVVQGVTPTNGTPVTLYFDAETGLLRRQMRFVDSPVGPLVTQWDYENYKDVNGFKMPFKLTNTWLDGREIMDITQIRTNVAIDAARFNKPAASVPPKK